MPEQFKALIVILTLATVVFALAKAPACAIATARGDYERRRNLWVGITLVAYLAHNFWIYIVVVGFMLFTAQRREQNALAMFLFLLMVVPRVFAFIPGLGIIENLFSIDYFRLLVLTVLLPAFLALRAQPDTEPFGRSVADKLIAGYLVLTFLLMLAHSSFTVTLRHGVFNVFVDVFLPYYVASRSLRNLQAFRDALMAFAVAALVLSAILFLEFSWHWLVYPSLERALGLRWGWNNYLERGGNLRASGPIGHPIVAGYVVAVATGFYLYLKSIVPKRAIWQLGLALLIAGLIAALSRGPWVGAAIMLLVFIATGPAAATNLAKLGLAGVVSLPLILASPLGGRIIDYLPFVGTIQAENVVGRQLLAETSIALFLENPILGRYDYIESSAMEALRGSDGLIDVVNTYAIVGLGSGLVGLSLFVGFFATVLIGIYHGMRNLPDRSDERYVMGRGLLATLAGILFIIGTMSPVLLVAPVYWTVAGIGVAYARILVPKGADMKIPRNAAPATGASSQLAASSGRR
jgi:hypothetical protein